MRVFNSFVVFSFRMRNVGRLNLYEFESGRRRASVAASKTFPPDFMQHKILWDEGWGSNIHPIVRK